MEDFIQKKSELLCLFFGKFFTLCGENIKNSMNSVPSITPESPPLPPAATGAPVFPPSVKKLLGAALISSGTHRHGINLL